MNIRKYLRLDDVEYWTGVLMGITGSALSPPKEIQAVEESGPVLTLVEGTKQAHETPVDTANVS